MLIKNFVCLPVRDPASPPQQPAILTVAGLAARRTDSFRVRSGICRADQTVGNRHGDTGHCSRGPKARNRFAPYSKGNSPIRGKADLKIFVCPPMNGTSPLEERISIYLFGHSGWERLFRKSLRSASRRANNFEEFCLSAGTRSGVTSAAPCDPDNRRPRRTADRLLQSTERNMPSR